MTEGTPSILSHTTKLRVLVDALEEAVGAKNWPLIETLARDALGYCSRLHMRAKTVNELRAEGTL